MSRDSSNAVGPVEPAPDMPSAAQDEAAAGPEDAQPSGVVAGVAGVIGNHKGKLAVGAAAMLGVAIFYKWRESRLAKEEPEEYARLQRLKAALGKDAEQAGETGKADKTDRTK